MKNIEKKKHHLIPIKKEPHNIIFPTGINESASNTSREIIDDLPQSKKFF